MPTLDTKQGMPPTSLLDPIGMSRERGHGLKRKKGGKALGTIRVAVKMRRGVL